MLIEEAKIIKSVFRSQDVIARIGGDEFCVFAFDLITKDLIKKRAETLNKLGRITKKTATGEEIAVSLSVGAACTTEVGPVFKKLYNKADEALYVAKNCGKGCYKIYGEGVSCTI